MRFFATGFVGFVAFVPAAVLIAIAETFDIRSIFYYAIGGAAIGAFAYYGSDLSVAAGKYHRLAAGAVRPAACRIAAGIIGGFVYWLFAGRKAGRSGKIRWRPL